MRCIGWRTLSNSDRLCYYPCSSLKCYIQRTLQLHEILDLYRFTIIMRMWQVIYKRRCSCQQDVITQRFHSERSVSSCIWLYPRNLSSIHWSIYTQFSFRCAFHYVIPLWLVIWYILYPFLHWLTTCLSHSEWKKYWQSIRIIYIGVITSLIVFQALWAFFAALDMVSQSEAQFSEWWIIRSTITLKIFQKSVHTDSSVGFKIICLSLRCLELIWFTCIFSSSSC